MGEEQAAPPVHVPADLHNVDQTWENLPAGLKARAMRTVYDETQRLVIELQRLIMEKGAEIAVGVARAKAAQELSQEDLKNRIIETELIPKRKELEELERQVEQGRELLDAYSRIGKGII